MLIDARDLAVLPQATRDGLRLFRDRAELRQTTCREVSLTLSQYLSAGRALVDGREVACIADRLCAPSVMNRAEFVEWITASFDVYEI